MYNKPLLWRLVNGVFERSPMCRVLFCATGAAIILAVLASKHCLELSWTLSLLVGGAVCLILGIPSVVLGIRDIKDSKRWDRLFENRG
jgi:uncharacterized membrane protein YjjP (DUF1212 family)